ncbi:MAG: flavin reductase family protein [Chloroflexi bacterium]|nr:flavin reductase family protein [Chloroflexota bacterium]MBU1746248.1 flavin reductase family protein [Chloroflexota bacterium]
MARITKRPGTVLYPVPVVLVTCVNGAGKPNIITLAWAGTVCSSPPMVGIGVRPSRYSHDLIRDSGEFVVNIPTAALLGAVDRCGTVSGADVDKFEVANLTALPASHVRAPLIAECPVNLECQVRQAVSLGSHTLFLGEIITVHMDEAVLGSGERLDVQLAQPIAFANGEYWTLGDQLGAIGFSQKTNR